VLRSRPPCGRCIECSRRGRRWSAGTRICRTVTGGRGSWSDATDFFFSGGGEGRPHGIGYALALGVDREVRGCSASGGWLRGPDGFCRGHGGLALSCRWRTVHALPVTDIAEAGGVVSGDVERCCWAIGERTGLRVRMRTWEGAVCSLRDAPVNPACDDAPAGIGDVSISGA
jgi:hypothetical protein